jgi:hypothetical protein
LKKYKIYKNEENKERKKVRPVEVVIFKSKLYNISLFSHIEVNVNLTLVKLPSPCERDIACNSHIKYFFVAVKDLNS